MLAFWSYVIQAPIKGALPSPLLSERPKKYLQKWLGYVLYNSAKGFENWEQKPGYEPSFDDHLFRSSCLRVSEPVAQGVGVGLDEAGQGDALV